MNQLGGAAQVCCLRSGTYTVSTTLRPANSGTASAPLVLRKDPAAPNPATKPAANIPCSLNADRVTVQYTGTSWSFLNFGGSDGSARSNWVVEGIDFDLNGKNTGGIILPEQSRGFLLQNSVVRNSSGNSAVRISGDDAQVLDNCISDSFSTADPARDIMGVSIVGVDTRNGGSATAVPERVRVARNWIYDHQGDGIHCNDGSDYDSSMCVPETNRKCTPNPAGPPRNLWLEDNRIFTTATNQRKTENAVDIKSCADVSIRGTGDPRADQPDSAQAQNKFSGFRKKTTEPGTTGGAAVVVHYNAKRILIENTRIWDSGNGISIGRDVLRFDKGATEQIVIKNNLIFNICSAPDCIGTGIHVLKAKHVDVFQNTIDNVPGAAYRFATWDKFNERSVDIDFWNNIVRSDGTYWIETNRSLIEDCESGYNLFWGTGASSSTVKFAMHGGGCAGGGTAGGLSWWQACKDAQTLLVADDVGFSSTALPTTGGRSMTSCSACPSSSTPRSSTRSCSSAGRSSRSSSTPTSFRASSARACRRSTRLWWARWPRVSSGWIATAPSAKSWPER